MDIVYVFRFLAVLLLLGLTMEELEQLASPNSTVMKVSTRDLSYSLSQVFSRNIVNLVVLGNVSILVTFSHLKNSRVKIFIL